MQFSFLHLASSLLICCLAGSGSGQILTSTFDTGTTPPGWSLQGAGGVTSAALELYGNGADDSGWKTRVESSAAGEYVRVSFRARAERGGEGAIIAGFSSCSHDFKPDAQWQTHDVVCCLPDSGEKLQLRLAQWHVSGRVSFSGVSVSRVQPVYARGAGETLGTGESVDDATYCFEAPFAADGDCARPLIDASASFNTNRWCFFEGKKVVYRHALDTAGQTSGSVTVNLQHFVGGKCVISASTDGSQWTEIGSATRQGTQSFELPVALFPAKQVFVSISGARDTTQPVTFQLSRYDYKAQLDRKFAQAIGRTVFVEEQACAKGFHCAVTGITPSKINLAVSNDSPLPRAEFSVRAEQAEVPRAPITSVTRALAANASESVDVFLKGASPGEAVVQIEARDAASSAVLYLGRASVRFAHYELTNYGSRIRGTQAVWWCDSTRKIMPHRSMPEQVSDAVELSGAGRERVHAQVVCMPDQTSTVTVEASDLRSGSGGTIPRSAIRVRRVGYVPVRTPTDALGGVGEWPDPLLPIHGGIEAQGGRCNPMWLTITIPADCRAGDYTGELRLTIGSRREIVPLKLHVYGFSLPEKTDLRSGFGVSLERIRQYHNLKSEDAVTSVWDSYMRSFAEKRLCPYDPMALGPITCSAHGEGSSETVEIDWSRYDRGATRYLDELGFNSFVLHLLGLGGGRAPKFTKGEILGAQEGSDRYGRLMRDYGAKVKEHLDRRGWTPKAYVYWYDEPTPEDYVLVTSGMATLKKYFPGVNRMLTEEFQPPLLGSVDLWCPILNAFNAEQSDQRQKLGEEVWWYICCGPRAPYVGEFIDHPGMDLRMWLWQTWKYHVQGILIWETCWWSTPGSKQSSLQNPYEDSMSYDEHGNPAWGNGDGRFFYPPTGDPARDPREFVTEPIDSMRWELLSIGVQDWEYFNLLKKACEAAEKAGVAPEKVVAARKLLEVPPEICRDLKRYTYDPGLLDAHREKMARAIESLQSRMAKH